MTDRQTVIDSIIRNRIILIFRGVTKENVIQVADAVYKGGIRVMEFAFDASGRMQDGYTAELITAVKDHFGGFVTIGAGTVLNPRQVEIAEKAGADFIISPAVLPEVVKETLERGLVSIPGALTPTEAVNACNLGADFVKLFPAGQGGGPEYLKAVATPLSHIRFLAVAGIEFEDAADYLRAGACGLGVSSGILNHDMLQKDDYAGITELARKYVKYIR